MVITKDEIDAIDQEKMYDSIASMHNQIKDGLKLAENIRILEEVDDIIIAGMGGSCLHGEILKSLFIDSKLRITLVKDYALPAWAGKRTLVFATSYSGNTEEALYCYRDATKKGCIIVAMASGGKLQQNAKKNETTFIKLPKPFEGFQPRAGIGYLFFAMLGVLQNSRIIPDMTKDIDKTIRALNPERYKEKAMELAEHIADKVPIIYTSAKLAAAGYKWKISFNENAKTHAFFNVYPEQNHNEINAYINLEAHYHVVFLSNDNDHPQIKKRMKITKALYQKKNVPVTEIAIKGDSMLTKIFSAIMIGDLVALFVAVKYATDPTPVAMVEDLKKDL